MTYTIYLGVDSRVQKKLRFLKKKRKKVARELQCDYVDSVKAKVIQIGNSRGIRLPKVILTQLGITDEVDVESREDSLIIRPVKSTRSGWAEAFANAVASGEEELLDSEEVAKESEWDSSEWEWT